MGVFDSPERCVLVLFVKFKFAKSMNSNTLRRSFNLFELPHSSFVFSVGFNSLIKTASVTCLSIASPEHIYLRLCLDGIMPL